MGRPRKIKQTTSPSMDEMRLDIGKLIDSFNFSYSHHYTESFIRNKASEITKAIEKQFGKYFIVTEEISGPDMRPPYYVSWKIEERV